MVGCEPDLLGTLTVTALCNTCSDVKCQCDPTKDKNYARFADPVGTPEPLCGQDKSQFFSPLNVDYQQNHEGTASP